METAKTIAATTKLCGQCGVDLGFYQKQIRRLREKLEYAELNNLKLASECNKLRKELSEAEFRGRSSVLRRPSPILPDEILHEIFSFATHVDGELVSPHWRVEEPYLPWVISSQARRSIPLVCRQWYDVGLEYLYQHIVLFTHRQLISLLYIIDYFARDPELQPKRLGWIRGLEIVLLRDDISKGYELTRRICGLIRRLPQGRLRLFGFEDGACELYTSPKMTEIVADALHKAEGSLEVLHLPCIQAAKDMHGNTRYPSISGDFDLSTGGFQGFSKLRIISLTSGRWEMCGGSHRKDTDPDVLWFLSRNPHSIHTIYLNWKSQSYRYLDFPHLHTIHVLIGRTELMAEDLDDFLEAVPQLRCLIITPSDRGPEHRRELTRDVVSHEFLEEVVLVMDLPRSYKAILVANPIFSKIKTGHLPRLKRVVVRGKYPEGCIDGGLILSQRHRQCWKDAIMTCAQQEVHLVNEQGNSIHIWSDQHGVRILSEYEDTESEASSSEEVEWWELSSSGFSGSSVASDDVISNDSEDGPYRYVSQPDLDYDPSSVVSDG